MKLLIVGDSHAQSSSLGEMGRLVDYICDTAEIESVDSIVLLGDNYHNHGILHLPVINFWIKSFKQMTEVAPVISLVGNHDLSGSDPLVHSMMIHKDITVVRDSLEYQGLLFVGYQSKNDKFIEYCNASTLNTIICHQTFQGSIYENGFYAKDGIDPEAIAQNSIISGHIHKNQQFGKVNYLGSPRWMSISDANTEKAIWVIEFNSEGLVTNIKAYPTNEVCTPIYQVDDSPEAQFEPTEAYQKANTTVDITGPVDYIKERVKYFTDYGLKVRTFPTKNFTSNVKESEGIQLALFKFTNLFTSKNGTPTDSLLKLVKERITWMG